MTATKRFWSCEEMCPCDDYVEAPEPDPFLFEWTIMVEGSAPAGPQLWCPHCRALCREVLEYRVPEPPFDVDGDGWFFRPLRPEEDPEALDRLVGLDGFVCWDSQRLYLHTNERYRGYA